MKRLPITTIIGAASLICLALAINIMLLRQTIFLVWVVVPLGVGLVLGAVWLVAAMARMASGSYTGKSLQGLNSIVAVVLFLAICITIFAAARHPRASWDLTQEGRQQLSQQTIQVLENLDRDVEVYGLFITAGDSLAAITQDKTRRFLERCQRYTDHLQIEFADPERDSMILQRLNVPRVSLQGTVVVRSGARQRVIPLSGESARLEERDFTNAVINVVRSAEPKVYFLTGHGQADIMNTDPDQGASMMREHLEAESYQVEQLSLMAAEAEVPTDCDILVINGQNRDLHPRELDALRAYMERGGRMMVLFDLWTVQETPGQPSTEQLRPWLRDDFGIDVGNNIILTQQTQAEVLLVPNFGQLMLSGDRRGSFNTEHPITRAFDSSIVFTGARSVSMKDSPPNGVVGEPIIYSPPDSMAEHNIQRLLDTGQISHDPAEELRSYPLGVAVTAKTDIPVGDTDQTRDARLVVLGNREFTSNGRIRIVGHANFIMNAFAWLSETPELIAIRARSHEPPPVLLTPAQEQAIAWTASLGVLHLVVIAGAVMYYIRGRYR